MCINDAPLIYTVYIVTKAKLTVYDLNVIYNV